MGSSLKIFKNLKKKKKGMTLAKSVECEQVT